MPNAEHWVCPDCGPHVAADEDGCCATCGVEAYGEACGGHVCGTRLFAAEAERDHLAARVAALTEALSDAVVLMAIPIEVWDRAASMAQADGQKLTRIVLDHRVIDRYAEAIGRWEPLLPQDALAAQKEES